MVVRGYWFGYEGGARVLVLGYEGGARVLVRVRGWCEGISSGARVVRGY